MLQTDSFLLAQSGAVPSPTIPSNHLSIKLIGSLQIRRGEATLDAYSLGGPKPRQILEILLLHFGTPVSKDRLIELLWAGRAPAEALPTLESYVSVLRRNLQPGSGKSGPLRTTTGGYVIDRSMVDLDLDRFDALLHTAHQSAPAVAYGVLQDALDLAVAPLLGDELLPVWAEDERALHANRVIEARILAAETCSALGKHDEAVDSANKVLASDPLNERAWTALILALEQAGRHAEGLQSYERCRRALDRELGCAPSATLREAHVRLLQATAHSEGDFSEVLSALLVLHSQLSRASDVDAIAPVLDIPSVRISLREAGNVVNSFLRKAMATA